MGLSRYLRFNAVGVAGFVVQLAVLALLTRWDSASPLVATAIAVEAAVLHNFFWHERWTWADRVLPAGRARLARLWRFHLTNGLVSIAGNVAIVFWLSPVVSGFSRTFEPIAANAIAVSICSLLNVAAGDRLVFSAGLRPLASGLNQSLRAARSSPMYP